MKEKLLVSFSGGETSAYMAQHMWKNYQDEYELLFVFANTGLEDEKTLIFVDMCSKHFGFPVVWVESEVHYGKRIGSTHKIVDFESASRKGQPFEDIIKKYGIPNQAFPHCTRELKLNPINSYARYFWKGQKYNTAIGIRADEIDRVNSKYKERRLMYPLVTNGITKPMINTWWSEQPFRLGLKGYQGNCKTCWKKTDKKLYLIAKEEPESFNFMQEMEDKYPRFGPEFIKDETCVDRTFFRKNRSAKDILAEAVNWSGEVLDDSDIYDMDYSESCEVWSDCGNK